MFCFQFLFYFYTIFKGYFPLTVIKKYWLYSLCCIQYILELILYPIFCTSQSLTLICPPLVTISFSSMSVSLFLFYSRVCLIFGEDSWEFWTARRSNQSVLKESTLNIHWKDCCWSWSSNVLGTWCKEPTHWKRPWHWERVRAGGKAGGRGWDGWIASPIQWTWIWAHSGR